MERKVFEEEGRKERIKGRKTEGENKETGKE
jgi:hypothetical protein